MSEESGSIEAAGIAVTAMFVEVLVTGIGFTSALSIGALALTKEPSEHIFGKLGGPGGAAIFLSVAYVLGIVLDRLADALLGRWAKKLRKEYFPNSDEYTAAKIEASKVSSIAAQSTYAKSRARVCRGWIINFPLLTAALDFWISRMRHPGGTTSDLILCSATGLILTAATVYSWRSIVTTGYRKLRKEANVLQRAGD